MHVKFYDLEVSMQKMKQIFENMRYLHLVIHRFMDTLVRLKKMQLSI